MTQGLQFSVLFSSADNMLSIDATAANLSQTSPELQQQAERFRQVLASEQADGAVRQDFAAVKHDAGHGVNHQVTPAMPGKDTQSAKAATESAETNSLPAESDEVQEGTDAAGELLGLIQRANLTASQLQKKAAAAAELHQLVPQLPLDKAEPVEDELSDLAEMAVTVVTDKDLTGRNEIAGQSHSKLKAVTPLLPEYTITPVPGPVVTSDNETTAIAVNSETKAQVATKLQTAPVTLVDTEAPEDSLTPIPGAKLNAVISEARVQNTVTEQKVSEHKTLEQRSSALQVSKLKATDLMATKTEQSAQTQATESATLQSAQTTPEPDVTETVKSARAAEKQPSPEVSLTGKAGQGDALTPIPESDMPVAAITNKAQVSQHTQLSTSAEATLDQQQRQAPLAGFNQNVTAAAAEADITTVANQASAAMALKQANPNEQQPEAKQPNGNTQSLDQNEKMTTVTAEIAEMSQFEAVSRETELAVTLTSTSTASQEQSTFAKMTSTEGDRVIAGRENVVTRSVADSNLVTEALPTTQAAVQAEAVARSATATTDAGNNQESKASRQVKEPISDSTSGADTLKLDTNSKSGTNERGAEQGTEQRLFQPSRLEVTLASGSSGQGSTQSESFQQQLARLDASVASVVAAQRASEKTPVPELSARLKQLNLQQQDAAGQLRERVQLMVRQNIQVAEIRLDPAELGQMQIRINLQQEQASVQFIVQQQQAKELLEQQMPRLREMLQQQGIQLGDGQVQQQSRQQQGNGDGSQRQTQTANQPADGFSDDLPAASTVEVQHRERLVDYYA